MKGILDILSMSEHYGVSEIVEIAKGKYELITDWKDCKKKIKRILKYGKNDR